MMYQVSIAFAFLLALGNAAAQTNRGQPPIIDMHLHAVPADLPARTGMPEQLGGLQPAKTNDELLRATLQAMDVTDAEIQAEIAKQIREKLALVAAKLRESAQHHGPVIRKTLNQVADDMEQFA
jgi:hypothetical protein